MEEKVKLIEDLFEKVTDYSKTSYDLVRLKAVDKTTDIVSSLIPHSVFVVMVLTFLLFVNLGAAFWLGDILGKVYFGFFVIAGFNGLLGLIMHLFIHKSLKKYFRNYIIKLLLN